MIIGENTGQCQLVYIKLIELNIIFSVLLSIRYFSFLRAIDCRHKLVFKTYAVAFKIAVPLYQKFVE